MPIEHDRLIGSLNLGSYEIEFSMKKARRVIFDNDE